MLGEGFATHEAPFAFLDLEMSGLEPMRHEILEIAVVRVSQPGLQALESWSTKVLPEHAETADPVSLKMIGYSDESWKDAVSLQEAMELFVEKTRGHVVAGWNVAYDWAFLEVAMGKTGVRSSVHKRILDVMSFAYNWLYLDRPLGDMGLAKIAKMFGIVQERHHEALADTMATFEVYKKLVEQHSS